LWTAVNIFNFLVPGLLVDASTGALHALNPGEVRADLVPADSSTGGPSKEQRGNP
jgi:hypothetical protein